MKNIEDFNNSNIQIDQINIYQVLHTIKAVHIFFEVLKEHSHKWTDFWAIKQDSEYLYTRNPMESILSLKQN